MFCNQCGTELQENSLFCHKCGNKVNNLDGETQNNEQVNEEKVINETENSEPSVTESAPKKSKWLTKKKLIILAIVFALVVGGAVLIICLASSGSSSSYSSSYDSSSSMEDSLEYLATSALTVELREEFSYTNLYDIGSTRYSIGTITEDDDEWIVRGTFSMYDYYGKISSSYYNETFTVRIDKDTYGTTCTTSI